MTISRFLEVELLDKQWLLSKKITMTIKIKNNLPNCLDTTTSTLSIIV